MRASTPVLMDLFDGFREAHGTYQTTGEENGKKIGKAFTVRKTVTVEKWEAHLDGKQGIGIIPITYQNTVKWGAIDIDDYKTDFPRICRAITESNLPLVPCRSKSGGLHLFLFLTTFAPASLVQDKLKEIAAAIGHGGVEIFPKQTQILAERGDLGQWVNMPYFDDSHTNRFALDEYGNGVGLEEFIRIAGERRITPEALQELVVSPPDALRDGPPCLQLLIKNGFPKGTRNNGLFALGVYAKKKDPDNWVKELDHLNKVYMVPPLTSAEVQGVVKSLGKKEYFYACEQPPLKDYCNKSKCRTCKYGIGTGAGLPVMTTLTKLCTVPPTWFMDVEGGGRLALSTDELQSPLLFQRRCMEALNKMPPILKRDAWGDLISKLMENVQFIEMPIDTTPAGQFREHLEVFCTGRSQARLPEEILLGKPYLLDGWHIFRIKDLLSFLQRNKFVDTEVHMVTRMLRDEGGEPLVMSIRQRGIALWKVKQFDGVGKLEPIRPERNEAY